MNLSELVGGIALPPKGAPYYSHTSVDGYAWLAAAKAMLGIDYAAELEIVTRDEAFGLRVPYTILGKRCTAGATYTYSCWPVWELAKAIPSDSLMRRVNAELRLIPFHETDGAEAGAIDYVSEGCDYLVPNMQALGALMLPEHSAQLIKWLEQNQAADGNWPYTIIRTQKNNRKEDVTHLAIMVCALRELGAKGGMLDKSCRLDSTQFSNTHPRRIRWMGSTLHAASNPWAR